MTTKILNWNVNSIKIRINHLLEILKTEQIDVALLQEIKCLNENFPFMEIEELGYNIEVQGQKTFNGVAILSKKPLEDVNKKLPDLTDNPDPQARFIEAVTQIGDKVARIISVYVPNGSEVGSDKYQYKLEFYQRLNSYIRKLLEYDEYLIIAGDFNVANLEIDVYDPKHLENNICFEITERKAFRKLLNLGLIDAHRLLNPQERSFTWWDYRAGAFNYNKGLKIDYFLLNSKATEILSDYKCLNKYRAYEKPSDHAPILLELNNDN